MNLNIIGGIKNRGITGSMSLGGLVEYIRNPDIPHLEKVKAARLAGKGTTQYEYIKENQIPCAILNFTHTKGYVKGNTVNKPTGYLYLDVDNNTNINLTSPHIAAYWRSLSNMGYSIVVAVKGLTKKNVKSATREVAELLDIPIDTAAISVDRLTCISYDPNAYFNPNAEVYHIVGMYDKIGHPVSTEEEYSSMGLKPDVSFSGIRVNNLSDLYGGIEFNGELLFDAGEGGIMYADIRYSIYGVTEGSRNKVMYSTTLQLRALNPWCGEDRMLKYIKGLNRRAFHPMLNEEEVTKIVQSAFKVKKPKLVLNRKRRFFYNPDYDLTAKQKRSFTAQHLNKRRTETTTALLNDLISSWDFRRRGKITMSKLGEAAAITLKTVQRRSGEIKEKIKQKNLAYKKSSN